MSDLKVLSCQSRVAALLIGVFVLGLGSGAVGMRAYEKRFEQADDLPNTEEVHGLAGLVAEDLAEDLGLAPDQARRIEQILDEAIMMEADLLTQLNAVRLAGRRQILEILDDRQEVLLEERTLTSEAMD